MRRGRNTIQISLWVGALVLASAFIVSCGRNWCIGPFGPCEQYTKMDPAKLAASTSSASNVCGWNSTGNPRNNLRIEASREGFGGSLSVRVGDDIRIRADGGTNPYQLVLKNPAMGTINNDTITPSRGSWKFRTALAGIACLKVLDTGMSIDTPCDTCWIAIVVQP